MWSSIKSSLVAAVIAALALDSASAIKVLVKNQCADEFILSHVGTKRVISADPFMPGSSITKEFAMGTISQVFKAGTGAQATLAEITVDQGKVYLDISIIPTGVKHGPDSCKSLEECKTHTGGVGYNMPMQIIPSAPPSRQFPSCTTITCMYDGCPEAYHFPDDLKTRVCGPNTDLEVIFCPGGPGRKTDPPTPPPSTPAPTTPEPTTQAPAENESLSFNGTGFLGDHGSGSATIGEDRALDLEVPPPTSPVVEPAPVATAPQTEVQEVTTRSSNESSTGAEVYVLLSVGAAAAVAASAIFVLRKKKQALEALDDKTPRTTTAAGAAFVLATPQESTVL